MINRRTHALQATCVAHPRSSRQHLQAAQQFTWTVSLSAWTPAYFPLH